MNIDRVFAGAKYTFRIASEKSLGEGGNGEVYKVFCDEIAFPVVAKFFKGNSRSKERRYERFKREVSVLAKLSDIDGLIEILDYNLPDEVPQEPFGAWYLMPKATKFTVNSKKYLADKLEDMLQLANILKDLHSKNYAHRDIKPENILYYNGKIILADFGLVWLDSGDRLTAFDEKVGPYKILPPELEHVDPGTNMLYMPSDVYLFAKLLWMTLKNDNIGFRGQYNRQNSQIYIDKNTYGVTTLEPIHKLLYGATFDEIDKRITIEECISYIHMQQYVLESGTEDKELINKLLYEEKMQHILQRTPADNVVYTEKEKIYEMISNVFSVSKIEVINLKNDRSNSIVATDFDVVNEEYCRLIYYSDGTKIKEFILSIKDVSYSYKKDQLEVTLNDAELLDNDCLSYEESLRAFDYPCVKIQLSSNEKIIMSSK